jgi:hypothetical protein
MSGVSIPGVIAAAITLYFTGGNFAAAAFAYTLASGIESYVMAEPTQGPRLEDRKIQLSTYGAQIPIVFGSARLAGNVIWPRDFEVEEHGTTESSKGGPETTNYSYSATFALLLCQGPIEGIGRIWMNKKLMYDPGSVRTTDPAIVGMTVYLGTEDQEPDPLMVARDGSAPAYRGWAYIVFEDLELTNSGFGNRPPSVEVEVFTEATYSGPPEPRAVDLGISSTVPSFASPIATIDISTDWIWTVQPNGSHTDTVHVRVVSDVGEVVIAAFDEIHPSGDTFRVGSVAALPEQQEVWVLTESWPIPDRRALIARFSSGSSTVGGIASVAPVFIGWVRIPTLIDARNMIYDAATGWIWIAYNFTTVTPLTLGVIQTIDQSVRSSLSTGVTIGVPSSMAVGYPYLGIVGSLGPASPTPNFMCVDSGLVNVIYSIRLPITPSSSNKAIDYDPVRSRFIVIPSTGFTYCLVDALSGTASTYTIAASANADTSPAPNPFGVSSVTYLPISDKYIFGANTSGAYGSTLFVVNAATLTVENTYTYESGTNELLSVLLPPGDPAVGNYVIGFDPTHAKRLMLGGDVVGGPVTLASIVSTLCTSEPFGLDPADIDVTELTDLVDGYLVGQQMSRRAAIEPLMAAYFFDGVESDHVMKYVKRGGASVVTIPQDDRAAHEDGEELPAHLNIMRASELELPWTIDVSYTDKERDYQPATQYDRRITQNANDPRRIELAIVMTAEKAKQVALVNLYLPWLRTRFGFSTTVAYSKYEPTDVVTLPTDGVTYVARITRRVDQGNGILQWEAELEDSAIYTQTGTVAAQTFVPQTIRDPGETDLIMLDTPILRDVDNDAGFYVAMGGSTDEWPGAQLFKSTDSGASYASMLSIVNDATIGAASGALGNFTAGNIFDEGNSVTVVLTSGGPLVSATADQVLNGSNTAVLGAHGRWEVINFKIATLTATDTYLLSGLLRGRRGTEWATGTHVAGDAFIVASTTTWQRPNPGSAEIGLARLYKAPPFGTQLSAADSQSFTNSAVGLEPYAPVDLAGARDGSNNLTITWHRRARYGYGALHTIVPLGETTESYSVDVMSGASVVRTIASATQTAAYTYAQQVNDFGFAQSSVTVNVYQLSSVVGRGYALNGTV